MTLIQPLVHKERSWTAPNQDRHIESHDLLGWDGISADGPFSSFAVTGRDSLPTEPSSWLASPLAFATRSEGSGLGTKAEGVQAEGQWLGTGEGLGSMSANAGQVARGESLFSSSGLFRASNQRNETNQIDQTDQSLLSLRQIAPAGFLTQAFAMEGSSSCQS